MVRDPFGGFFVGASKGTGWILFLVGLAASGYGLAALVVGDRLPMGDDSTIVTAEVAAGIVLVGLGLLMITRKPPPAPVPVAAPAPVPIQTVEIKRTEMRWGETPPPMDAPAVDRLEDVRQRIARIKVQYGLGEISREAYGRLLKDLEAEAAELEAAQFRGETTA